MKATPSLVIWNFRSLTVVGSLTALLALASCGGHSRTRPLTSLSEPDRRMLEEYEGVRRALAQDDFRLAKRKVTLYMKALDEQNPSGPKPTFEAHLEKIASATTLENERDAFRAWSTQVIALTNGVEGFYLIHCPIPGCGDWVQKTANVDNPFMGKVMHDCGEVQK